MLAQLRDLCPVKYSLLRVDLLLDLLQFPAGIGTRGLESYNAADARHQQAEKPAGNDRERRIRSHY